MESVWPYGGTPLLDGRGGQIRPARVDDCLPDDVTERPMTSDVTISIPAVLQSRPQLPFAEGRVRPDPSPLSPRGQAVDWSPRVRMALTARRPHEELGTAAEYQQFSAVN